MAEEAYIVRTDEYQVVVGGDVFKKLGKHLKQDKYESARKFLLVDEQSLTHCYPLLAQEVEGLRDIEIIEVESGEAQKTPELAIELWRTLSHHEADRKSVIINLGGGVISDLGGFVASTYKRGIDYINIPTTLLAQVDASIGGKVGVNLDNLKNQVGLFNHPTGVFIHTGFLNTLPSREILCGFAEMIKHALISGKEYWKTLKELDFKQFDTWDDAVYKSIMIKNDVVKQDPKESGIRKVLNFGHTIGHALESYALENAGPRLLHGEAVALGMIAEAYLSYTMADLKEEELDEITTFILSKYRPYELHSMAFHRLIELMKNDKKNEGDEILFTLLNRIGKACFNKPVQADMIIESLNYYLEKAALTVQK